MKFTGILFTLMVCMLSVYTYSQNEQNHWQHLKDADGIQFLYQYTECHNNQNDKHMEYVLLKLVNTNPDTMLVEWKRDMWYNNNCLNCDSEDPEYIHELILKPGEEYNTECDSDFRGTKIFSKFLKHKGPELTQFEITHIKVTPK